MEGRTLGILLAHGPTTDDATLAFGLARAAIRRGTRTRLFLMWDGVDALEDEGLIEGLVRDGVEVSVCSQTAIKRRCPADRDGVDYSSQYRLADIVATATRFVSLT